MEQIIVEMNKEGRITQSTKSIGFSGENKSRQITFKLADDLGIIVDSVDLEIKQDSNKYLVQLVPEVLETEETVYILPIYNSLLTYPKLLMNLRINGAGENVIYKSELFAFEVLNSINAIDVVIPDEYPTIYDKLEDEIIDLDKRLDNVEDEFNDYYDKSEVNALIETVSSMNLLVVNELPTEDISTTTIYLVPKSTSQADNVYDEYIYVSDSWELIGDTQLDINGKQNRPTVTTSNLTTYTISSLEENTVYKLGNLTNLVISQISIFDIESIIYFTSNSTNVTIPSSLVNLGDVPELTTSGGANIGTCEANTNYIIAVLNNIAVWKAY